MNISKELSLVLKKSFETLKLFSIINPDEKIWQVYQANKKENEDYCFRGLFIISKLLKEKDINMSPSKVGEEICNNIKVNNNFKFSLKKNFIFFSLTKEGIKYYFKNFFKLNNMINETINKKNILVDFSSPNIAKDMHVGHLRSTIIGDTICNLFEEQGHNVYRVNHIGDFGLQFGMIIQQLFDNYDDFKKSGITISTLQEFYATSKKSFNEDDEFRKKAYQRVVDLQSNNKKVVEAWNFIKDVSREAYEGIYNRLNVTLDEVGESFYQSMIPSIVKELEEKNLLIVEEGRKIIKVAGYSVPLTIVKSDGGYTYDTTDLAAIRYRLIELKMDNIYYVVDVGQSLHFNLVFEIAKMAGWLTTQDVRHIGFGLVLGENGKRFRSRDGDTVKLIDLLDGSIEKAKEVLQTKETNLSKNESKKVITNVAYGAIKYADLSTCRTTSYKFSYDRMLSLEGNTAVYLLYAYVRISAIIRKSGDYFINSLQKINNFDIETKEEIELCKYIFKFPDIISRVSDNLQFHVLSEYLYNLSKVFHNFFKKCRCIQYENDKKTIKDVNYNRLLLSEMTRRVMAKCFNILNIETLEKM